MKIDAGDVSLKTCTKLSLWVCLYTIMMYLIAKENCRCLSLPLTGHLWISVLAVLIVWFGIPATYRNEAFMAALTLDNSEGSVCNDSRGVLMLSLCFISHVTTGIFVYMGFTTLWTKFFTWYILSAPILMPSMSWEKTVLLVRSENIYLTDVTVKMYNYNTDSSFWDSTTS